MKQAARCVFASAERKKAGITAEMLRERVHYDPETGKFTRLRGPSNAKAGEVNALGYVRLSILGMSSRGHVWAWLYMTGEWPKAEIDHINGCRTDNRWANLRLATIAANRQNQRRAQKRKDASPSLPLGVTMQGKRFVATIQAFGVKRRLGAFDDAGAAHAAYLDAKRRLHPGNTL